MMHVPVLLACYLFLFMALCIYKNTTISIRGRVDYV